MKVVVIVLTSWLLAGCQPVPVWSRSTLAHRCMRPDSRPEETRARIHMLGARESTQGAAGQKGGGCGCK
ncbi:MAG: DUF4266 domain-containing protein [Polyangiaceae bacterium]|nr:DUF4266 domain-containing protein [Polyangiaceae bacterium]